MVSESSDGKVICGQCGEKYSEIGTHWSKSSNCEYEGICELKMEMVVGLMMGDGCVGGKENKNQRVKVDWSSKRQCLWLDDCMGWLSTGVSHVRTPEESARNMEVSGLNGEKYSANTDNFSDMYEVYTRRHPNFSVFMDWYNSGEKVWPENIDLTPTTLLFWYVSDGDYNVYGTNNYISIAMKNEKNNTEKVCNYFSSADLPQPSFNRGGERPQWSVKDTNILLDYMKKSPFYSGGGPPGFEYKFLQ